MVPAKKKNVGPNKKQERLSFAPLMGIKRGRSSFWAFEWPLRSCGHPRKSVS